MRPAKIIFCVIVFFLVHSQTQAQSGNESFQIIKGDSIKVFFDSEYRLIDSSCAQIIRYSRFDFQRKKFFGRFKDINKDSTSQILCEGNYDDHGLKSGEFVTHYLNGKLHGKGTFSNNKYTGNWEFFNKSGRPQMTFTAVNGNVSMTNFWDKNDRQTVNNGNGRYQVDFQHSYYWTGNFVDGKQDATWKLMQKNNPDSIIVLTEYFKKGKFINGENKATNYSDSSHIILVDPNALNFINAENLRISPWSCDEVKIRKIFVGVKFVGGNDLILKLLKTLGEDFVIPYFNKAKHVRLYKGYIEVDGEIDEKGQLTNIGLDDKEDFDKKGFITKLMDMFPQVEPASAYGKPIKQKISFVFNYSDGSCLSEYQLAPYKLPQ